MALCWRGLACLVARLRCSPSVEPPLRLRPQCRLLAPAPHASRLLPGSARRGHAHSAPVAALRARARAAAVAASAAPVDALDDAAALALPAASDDDDDDGGAGAPAPSAPAVAAAPGEAASHRLPPASPRARLRLDALALATFPQHSRTTLQSWISQGKLLVDGAPLTKAGAPVRPTALLRLTADPARFVCRGGLKLEAALEHWGVDVNGMTALDAGLSTGGFSDCLLQRGAARVYGIDVGYGQVHDKLRRDERCIVMERVNLRNLAALPERVDIATLDLSFISVLKFEALRGQVGSGGVVRDAAVHADVLRRVTAGVEACGFAVRGTIESPLKGAKEGNTEFLLVADKVREPAVSAA